jgi:hypothetical protein
MQNGDPKGEKGRFVFRLNIGFWVLLDSRLQIILYTPHYSIQVHEQSFNENQGSHISM